MRVVCLFCVLLCIAQLGHAQPPKSHAKKIKIASKSCTQIEFTWISGDGSARVVFAKEGSPITTLPQKDSVYKGHSNFGAGKRLASTNVYSVYNGVGNNIRVNNLKKNTTYYFAIFEYTTNAGKPEYLTTTGYAQAHDTTDNIEARFTIADDYQCLDGNQFSYTDLSTNSRGDSMHSLWRFHEGRDIDTTYADNHVFTRGGRYVIELMVESVGCRDTAFDEVWVVVPHVVDFELDTRLSYDSTCLGETLFFKNLSQTPNPPIYGQWDRSRAEWTSNGKIKGTAFNFDLETQTSGVLAVKLKMSRQVRAGEKFCEDSITKTFYVHTETLTKDDVSVNQDFQEIDTNSFTFFHSANVVSTHWDFQDGDSSTSNPATHVYRNPGIYDVVCSVVDSMKCSQQQKIRVQVFENVSTKRIPSLKVTRPFPNPTGESFTLSNLDKPVRYRLVNYCGKLELSGNISRQNSIAVHQLSSGIYLLYLDGYAPVKIIKK